MHIRIFAVAGIGIAAAIGFAACGSDDADPTAPQNVTGTWAGTTSQSKDIQFTVTSSGVTGATFSYLMSTTRCAFTATLPITTTSALAIADGRFDTGKTQIGSATFLTATGEFTSSTAATGTLLIQDAPCGDTLNLTWTASKQ